MPDLKQKGFIARRAIVGAAFGALILFGCSLRFSKLSDVGFWYDELWTVVGASHRPFMETYREWILGDAHPPGFFLFYFAWFKVVPATEFWARLPNAIAGVLTVAYLLVGTTRVLSSDERLLTASFAALSYIYVFYALTVKQYSAMLLFTTIATVTYLEIVAVQRIERRTGLVLAVACLAMAYLNHFAMVYAAMLLLLLLATFRRNQEVRRQILRIGCVGAVGYVPIAYFLYIQLEYNIDAWQPYQVPAFLANLGPSLFFDDSPYLTRALAILCGVLVVRMLGDSQARQMFRGSRNRHVALIVMAFGGFMLALGAFRPIFYVRYFLALAPVALLGLGIATAAAFPLERGWLAALPLIFFVHGAAAQYRSVEGLQREQWDRSVDLVLQSRTPPDAIYIVGANMDRTEFDYLKAGDVEGVFNVRNLRFYRYYFQRRGASDAAARLRVMLPTVDSVREVVSKFRDTNATIYILAGHHLQYRGEALATLEHAARRMEITPLNSTLVYKVVF